MISEELISLGIASIEDASSTQIPELELTPRELAETLLPDMCTVPMTDEEIERFLRG